MKHIFIINPTAGQAAGKAELEAKIHEACKDAAYEIHKTTAPQEATAYVRACCEREPNEELRFYACGGDGTLNEVAAGAYRYPNASVTCIPCGSGNDYVKCFGGAEAFQDLHKLMTNEATPVDLMQANEYICVNVLNFGFDTKVAKTIIKVRRKPIIGGKNAYTSGIVNALFTAMRTKCAITVDGEQILDGAMLLCTICNGQYVGGSFRCAPRAVVDDGLLEVCKCKCVNHFKFIKILKPYTAGQHLDDPMCEGLFTYRRGKEVDITGKGLSFSVDGEIIETDHLHITVMKGALRFVRP